MGNVSVGVRKTLLLGLLISRTTTNNVTRLRPALELPAMPNIPNDSHCDPKVLNWDDGFEFTNAWS